MYSVNIVIEMRLLNLSSLPLRAIDLKRSKVSEIVIAKIQRRFNEDIDRDRYVIEVSE